MDSNVAGFDHSIGIDIGGTKMAVALVDGRGLVRQRTLLPTEAELGFDRAISRLGASIQNLVDASGGRPITAIGIGCAGPLDPLHGLINNPYTLTGWDRCDVVSPLRQRFGVPVYLENDADVAAVGECLGGAGAGFSPVVMLTFGTGIGGAAVVDGEIYRGVHGEHPELGHIPVSAEGPACYCGRRGCLESIASGTAISTAGKPSGFADTRAVLAAAANGHAAARGIVERARQAAATAAWTICHTFLPERLVLGGGMMEEHFDLFAAAMRECLRSATQFTHQAVSIARAQLGNDAGIIGAARWALHKAHDARQG